MGYLGTKPANAPVTSDQISDGAVGTADIATSAVTPAKLSTGAPTWNSSGNLGLGVTPSAWGSYGNIDGQNGFTWSSYDASIGAGYYYNLGYKYKGTTAPSMYMPYGGSHKWFTAPSGTAGNAITFTQAMTLDSSGNLLVGTTSSPEKLCVVTSGSNNVGRFQVGVNGNGIIMSNASGTTVGSITINSSSTAYNTSSDYRLKENIAPMTGALGVVSQLKPVTYNWKVDGSAGQGFIAHELAEVVPDAVTGEKDAVDDEGKPVYQGIDTSFLVATLTAAIQEQQAIITDLKARIETLESK